MPHTIWAKPRDIERGLVESQGSLQIASHVKHLVKPHTLPRTKQPSWLKVQHAATKKCPNLLGRIPSSRRAYQNGGPLSMLFSGNLLFWASSGSPTQLVPCCLWGNASPPRSPSERTGPRPGSALMHLRLPPLAAVYALPPSRLPHPICFSAGKEGEHP